MAQRFGGKYSPDGDQTSGSANREAAVDQRAIQAAGSRGRLLYVPPILLVLTSLNNGPTTLVTALIGGGILTLAAWLLQEGLRAEAAYDMRRIARRPALPRKMLASALTGIGVAIAAFTGDSGVIGSVLYGIAALGLHVAAFGIDPLKDKRMEGIDDFQQDRVARVVDTAEAHLDVMKSQIAALGDRKLELRVAGFQAIARRMIRTVEEDPRDLTSARKFLGVYLLGARDATVQFADLYARSQNEEARADYEALLNDLESSFAQKTEKLLLDDKSSLDVEIEVLRDRLEREGVRSEI